MAPGDFGKLCWQVKISMKGMLMAKSMAGSAPSAPTRFAKPFNSYLLNKCIVGYGIINGIINAVIFYLMHLSEPELLFSEADIFHDFALTGVLLGILLFVIVVPLTRMDLRKGVFSGPNVANLGGAASLVPASYAPALLVATVAATVSLMGVGAFACVLLPLPLTVTGLMLLKGLVCACAGAVAGYVTICYVVRSGKSEA